MRIDENTIIKCDNLNEVKDCLDKLEELGFKVFFFNDKEQLIISKLKNNNEFKNYVWVDFYKENYCVNYKTFVKLYNKQIKKNKPGLIIDKNGKILKVNNIDKDYKVFIHSTYGNWIDEYVLTGECIAANLLEVDYYVIKEELEKALKRKKIENKLRALAFELNGNKDIDWTDEKLKYYLAYDSIDKTIFQDNWKVIKSQGTIYCYSFGFRNKAIELIGEEDLKDYLINC